jgi:ribonuclease P protein subunit RPR2
MNSTVKQIARQRVQILFQKATQTYKTNPQLAQTYISNARKIAMSARIRLPTEYKRSACKNCNTLLVPGETSRVRIRPRREPHLVATCLSCGSQTRMPLKSRNKIETNQNEQNINKDEASR